MTTFGSSTTANFANPEDESATLAELAPGPSSSGRDTHGRFQTGNIGGGRKKGSRNRFTTAVLNAVADDFAAHGAEALAALRKSDPASYIRILTSLIPRELIFQTESQQDFSDMTYSEVAEEFERQKKNKDLSNALKSHLGG